MRHAVEHISQLKGQYVEIAALVLSKFIHGQLNTSAYVRPSCFVLCSVKNESVMVMTTAAVFCGLILTAL